MSKKIIDLIATLIGIQLFLSISVAQEVSADLTQKIQQIRQWTIRGYASEEFNASSISRGHIEISSAFWSKESSFEPNEIRAILAHEISHVY